MTGPSSPRLPEHTVPLHTHSWKCPPLPFLFLALSPGSVCFSRSWKAFSFFSYLVLTFMGPRTPLGGDGCRQTGNPWGLQPNQASPKKLTVKLFLFSKCGLVLVDCPLAPRKASSICFMVTCAMGLSYLFHFRFTHGVSLTSRKNVCVGLCRLRRPPTMAWMVYTGGEDIIDSLQLWTWMLD